MASSKVKSGDRRNLPSTSAALPANPGRTQNQPFTRFCRNVIIAKYKFVVGLSKLFEKAVDISASLYSNFLGVRAQIQSIVL